jgi:lipopolysaccharide/colanic/teichoic acid biosynthesis glycosyltransferase
LPTRIQAQQTPPDALPAKGGQRPKRPKAPQAGRPLPPSAPVAAPAYRWYLPCKAALDRLTALALLALTGPLVLALALLVKLTSRGPSFYTQTRLGRHGRPFRIYKLRTMVNKCESLTGPRWSIPGDPRVTGLGRFLRRTHLDELPQLLNVLRGDMSLIGPRPERPEFLPELESACPHYRQRLAVRPGVTGLAQVQLPPDTSVLSVRRKLAYDLYYIRHLNPWLDLSLLVCTAFYALGVPFRFAGRLLRVPHGAKVEGDVQGATDGAARAAA